MSRSLRSQTKRTPPSAWWSAVVVVLLLFALPIESAGQELRADAAVEKLQVFVGEPFVFQVQVKGSESPEKPSLAGLDGFKVQEMGGQQNSSQSVTIVNGRMNRVSSKAYVYSYRLTPKRAGALTIPAITVRAEGKDLRTRPVTMRVQTPSETEDFKLRVSISESKAYVGQPVTMTVIWYVGTDVGEFNFNVPVLEDDRFDVASLDPKVDPNRQNDFIRIPLGDEQAIGVRGQGELDGRTFTTLRFQKVLIPKQAGRVGFPQATVSCQTRGSRRGLNDIFGDPFGLGRRGAPQKVVVPSNAASLQVNELPASGRPANFSGLVGRYSIEAEAMPTEMNVGDPITLTLRVEGPRYLAKTELPSLEHQTVLVRDFRIPQDRASGIVKGRSKEFTQTIRATHSGVTQIPPIELSYFNPDTEVYETAKTEPIPVTVEGTKIITARDAEGSSAGGVVQNELESLEGGIAHNYEDFDALENQVHGLAAWLRSPVWTAFIVVPPLGYFVLLGFLLWQGRQTDPVLRKARRAYGCLTATLDHLPETASDAAEQDAALLVALRQYLGDRLGLPAGSLTFADVRDDLEGRDIDSEIISELEGLFARCEAGRYAPGSLAGQDLEATVSRMIDAADRLEEVLG